MCPYKSRRHEFEGKKSKVGSTAITLACGQVEGLYIAVTLSIEVDSWASMTVLVRKLRLSRPELGTAALSTNDNRRYVFVLGNSLKCLQHLGKLFF